MSTLRRLVGALALVAATIALHPTSADARSRADDPSPVTVSGVVHDGGGRTPAGWTVTIGPASTETGDGGTYALVVPSGDHPVAVTVGDLSDPTLALRTRADVSFTADRTLDLTVPAVAIGVTLTDTNGSPVAGASVDPPGRGEPDAPIALAELFPDAGPTDGWSAASTTPTDDGGHASLEVLQDASVLSLAVAPAGNLRSTTINGVVPTADRHVAAVLDTLDGQVRDRRGGALAGEALTFTPPSSPPRVATTDGDGRYAVTLPPGSAAVEARRDRADGVSRPFSYDVRSSIDAAPRSLDLALPIVRVGVIVRSSAADPVAGARVSVPCTATTIALAAGASTTGSVCGSATTGVNGRASVLLLPAAKAEILVVPTRGAGLAAGTTTITPLAGDRTVTVVLPEQPGVGPAADAGADVAARTGARVVLAGASSDPDGQPLTYRWFQIGGPPVVLSSAKTDRPHFTAPATAATCTFRVQVTDADGLSDVDEVIVTTTSASPK